MPDTAAKSRTDSVPAECSGYTVSSTMPSQQCELSAEETSSPLAAVLVVSSFAGFLSGVTIFMLGGSWRVMFVTYVLITFLPVLIHIVRHLVVNDLNRADARGGNSKSKKMQATA